MALGETALAGTGGFILIPGTPYTPISYIHTWTMTVDAGNYDVSHLGDLWRHFIPGLRGWNGAIQGFFNIDNDPTGQKVLFDCLLNGTPVVLQMQTGSASAWFEGTANVTQFAMSDPVDNVITLDFTYVGTGSLQHSTS